MANNSPEQVNNSVEQLNKRGDHLWVKGKSGNPKGRPVSSPSLLAFYQDYDHFIIRHLRWDRFCWGLMEPPYTGAAAARKAGYSPRSARFIASRLLRKPVIRAMRKRQNELVDKACKQGHWP